MIVALAVAALKLLLLGRFRLQPKKSSCPAIFVFGSIQASLLRQHQ